MTCKFQASEDAFLMTCAVNRNTTMLAKNPARPRFFGVSHEVLLITDIYLFRSLNTTQYIA